MEYSQYKKQIPNNPVITTNNYWTQEMETVARHIKNQSIGYTWIYEKLVSKAQTCDKAIGITVSILSALTGTGGLIVTFENDLGWSGILISCIGFIGAILGIIQSTWNFGVIRTQGISTQTDFSNLSRMITYQLALRPSEREDAREFVINILKEIDKLVLNAPSIDGDIKKDYVQTFKNNPIYNPEGQNVTISQESFTYRPNYTDNLLVHKRNVITVSSEVPHDREDSDALGSIQHPSEMFADDIYNELDVLIDDFEYSQTPESSPSV